MASSNRYVNNGVFFTLGDRWYEADDDPIALLRAQARLHVPWIAERLRDTFGERPCRVVDVGCGAGFVANALARRGHEVVGVDVAHPSLEVAARHDTTRRVRYVEADAHALPFEDGSFEAACAMDFLEHVEDKDRIVAEIARVLAPGGLFFFHTFSRNLVSFLFVIKAVEWFVDNVPRDLHLLRLFLQPDELRAMCSEHGMAVCELHGCAPRLSLALVRMLATGVVPQDFEFHFTRRAWTGYSGVAEKIWRPPRGGPIDHWPNVVSQ